MIKILRRGQIMRLEQLRYIVEIADTGSFTAASERLFIAQPSISQAVKTLEEELHMTIFKRYRTGTIPTQEGRHILEHARNILNDIAEIEKISQREYRQLSANIAIGSIPTLSSLLLPAVISSYKEVFPNVNIYFSESGTKKIVEKCLKGEIDIGLISYHGDKQTEVPQSLLLRPLFNGQLAAFGGKNSLMAYHDTVTFKTLLPFPLLIYGNDFVLHTYCLEQISRYGKPNVISMTNNPETIKKYVAQTDAIAFGPYISLKNDIYVKEKQIYPSIISDAQEIHFCIITNKKRNLSVAVDFLIEEIVKKTKLL